MKPRPTSLLATGPWPGLLSPEQAVPWKPPRLLLPALKAGLERPDLKRAFATANRLSLELYRAGQADAAQAVCHRQITFAASALRDGRAAMKPWLVLSGLQSAVNLVRIHGYGQDLMYALAGLRRLEELADGTSAAVFGFTVPAHAVDASAVSRRLRVFARATVVMETSKIFFSWGMSGSRVEDIQRLCAKWPDLITEGPFHAHELLVLHGLGWPATGPDIGEVAPALALIARARRASAPDAGQDGHDQALALYREAAPQALGADTAQARYLAVLAEALYRHGESGAGQDCFRKAHALAAPLDPMLANGIVHRWRARTEARAVLPTPLAVPRPDPAQLLELMDLAASRFNPRAALR